MKYKKLKISAFVLLWAGLSGLQAQESVNTTGGEASGSGGSVSYSVGQVVYSTRVETNGSVAQGVQQPFEISVVTGVPEAQSIGIEVRVYPNPATDYLNIELGDYETTNLQYKVFDITGKLLQTGKILGKQTEIPTSLLTPANYFVKILDNKKEIKTFKIIKN